MIEVRLQAPSSSTRPLTRNSGPTDNAARASRRERNKQQKRDRIKAAARKLFSTKGFAATTTQEIAQEADIGTGTLFLYVQSKEEVLVLVFRDEMDRVCDEAFAALPRRASLLEQLTAVYGAMIRFHGRNQGLARVFVKEVMFVGEGLRQSIAEFVNGLEGRWVTLIETAKQRGELAADVPAAVLAENCFAAYLLLLQKWLGLGGPLATAEHIARLRQSFELQLRGLALPKTSRRSHVHAAVVRGTARHG
jgi:AcrR family transcriptional regulator